MKRFGRFIRERRKLLGMTQTELAAAAKVSTGTILNIERGKLQTRGSNMVTLNSLATALGVQPSEIHQRMRAESGGAAESTPAFTPSSWLESADQQELVKALSSVDLVNVARVIHAAAEAVQAASGGRIVTIGTIPVQSPASPDRGIALQGERK